MVTYDPFRYTTNDSRRLWRWPFTAVLILAILFLTGCSLEYDQNLIEDSMSEAIPDTVLYAFTHTVVRNGEPVFIITAGKAEAYGKRNRNVLSDVEFREYGRGGKILTEGKADHTVFHTDTENAELSGNLRFYSSREEGELTAGRLSWNSETKVLSGVEEETVILTRDSGSSIRGRGFEADFRSRSLTFEDDVEGIYRTESDDE